MGTTYVTGSDIGNTKTMKKRPLQDTRSCTPECQMLLGWFLKLTGPSLLELQLNTEVTFTMASSYITLFNVTQILGSLGVGFFLYKKVNTLLLITSTLAVAAASAVAIPLCFAYIPMLFSHVGFGLAVGALDMLMIAEMSALWGTDTEVPMHALYFTSSLGSVLSPICATPFLKNLGDVYVSSGSEIFDSPVNYSTSICNNLSIAQLEAEECITQQAVEAPSRLHIPYGISAGLSVSISFTTIVIFILHINKKFPITYNQSDTHEDKREVSRKFGFVVLLVTGLMSGLDTSIEESSGDFLPSFCVTQMGWNSQEKLQHIL
ncbi:major facilitator superfamily domain-containing protein 4A-like [Argopecten irradians]|uniref:major facilitator superfamily domain-containing protein 4A-like n=1 Tax=Argopecten irradians TaxID=31199 RepID=UPI003719BF18